MSMSNENTTRLIALHLKGAEEPLWAVRDAVVPLIGDFLTIEESDGTSTKYEVVSRTWIIAKQGESSFERVRLDLKKVPVKGTYIISELNI